MLLASRGMPSPPARRSSASTATACTAAAVPLRFVCIVSSRELKAGRMATHTGHHMSASLLDSQPAVLELPTAHEDALLLDLREMADELIERAEL